MSDQNFFGGDPIENEPFSAADRGDLVADLADSVAAPEPASPAVPDAPDSESAPADPVPEPEAESEPEAPDTQNTDKNLIPRSRFNEVNEAKRAAERRAQELEAQLNRAAPASDYDFDAQEKAYMDAVLDGEHDKALAIRREIRAAEFAQQQRAAAEVAYQAKDATKAELEFNQTVASIEAEYPMFDQTSPDYNPELVAEVLELHSGFVAQKYSLAAAMARAVNYVAKANGLQPASLAATAKAPATRTASTVKSKLDIATSQPPMQAGVSGGEVAPDYANLSDDEWDKLPPSTIARLRGDLA